MFSDLLGFLIYSHVSALVDSMSALFGASYFERPSSKPLAASVGECSLIVAFNHRGMASLVGVVT